MMSQATSKQDLIYKLARTRVKKLLAEISASSDATLSDTLIHEIRVCVKRLRALVQLYQPFCSKTDIKTVDRTIKDIAKAYAGQRDAVVQYALLCKAISEINQQDFQPLKAYFSEQISTAQTHDSDMIMVDQAFKHVLKVWKQTLSTNKSTNFNSGIDYTYRKCRNLSHKAIATDNDALYHASRKWIKYYFYQLKLLDREHKLVEKSRLKQLAEIGELLGEFHDQCVLAQALKQLMSDKPQTVVQKNEAFNSAIQSVLNWLMHQKRQSKLQFWSLNNKVFVHGL